MNTIILIISYLVVAIISYLAGFLFQEEPNPQLTLSQLSKRAGKPIYVVWYSQKEKEYYGGWHILQSVDLKSCTVTCTDYKSYWEDNLLECRVKFYDKEKELVW